MSSSRFGEWRHMSPAAIFTPFFSASLGGGDHAAHADGIGGEGFLHEDIHATLHGVLELLRAKARVAGEHRDVARAGPQRVDGPLESIKADELALRWHIDALLKFVVENRVRPLQAVVVQIGHGDELRGAAGGLHRIRHGAAAASAAADDGELNGITARGMDVRDGDPGQCGGGDDLASLLEKVTTS